MSRRKRWMYAGIGSEPVQGQRFRLTMKGRVVRLLKMTIGGNTIKASAGMNAAETRFQRKRH